MLPVMWMHGALTDLWVYYTHGTLCSLLSKLHSSKHCAQQKASHNQQTNPKEAEMSWTSSLAFPSSSQLRTFIFTSNLQNTSCFFFQCLLQTAQHQRNREGRNTILLQQLRNKIHCVSLAQPLKEHGVLWTLFGRLRWHGSVPLICTGSLSAEHTLSCRFTVCADCAEVVRGPGM